MLYVPRNDFNWQLFSEPNPTRPLTASGNLITPGVNTKGAYAQIFTGAEVARDVYGVLVNVNSSFTSAATRNALMDVGVDPAGGTAYSILLPDLQCGHAISYTLASGGIWYYFPVFIKAGSSIAARAASTVATAFNCRLGLFGSPRRPDLIRAGSFVRAFGVVPATSSGTIVVPGTTAEGAWSLLGTVAAGEQLWHWQCGMSVIDTTMAAVMYTADLGAGDATNKKLIMEEALFWETATEQLSNQPQLYGCTSLVDDGLSIYGRMQCSGTPSSSIGMIAYGVGG